MVIAVNTSVTIFKIYIFSKTKELEDEVTCHVSLNSRIDLEEAYGLG